MYDFSLYIITHTVTKVLQNNLEVTEIMLMFTCVFIAPLEESLEGDSIAVDLNADAHLEMKEVQNGETGGDFQNNKLLIGDINGDGAVESLPTEKGDSKNTPKSSPQKSQGQQGQQTDPYRMVCQCGAKNCRKFVF
jgi:hypothetical protein